MSRTNTSRTVEADKPEAVVESDKPVESKSEAKKAFKAIIEAYKKSNPTKYELKKEELQKKLDAIK